MNNEDLISRLERADEYEPLGYDGWAAAAALRTANARIAQLEARSGVTKSVKVRFTWASEDKEFWMHMSLPDGKSAGLNLGNPKGMIATACLRALVEPQEAHDDQ